MLSAPSVFARRSFSEGGPVPSVVQTVFFICGKEILPLDIGVIVLWKDILIKFSALHAC